MTLEIARLDTAASDFESRFRAMLARGGVEDEAVEQAVRAIIGEVARAGDAALIEATRRFDRVRASSVSELRLTPADFEAAFDRIDDGRRAALVEAAQRIRRYHEHQLTADWSFTDELGNRLGQRVTPLARVGLYVPGGQAAYPSTVLMTAIPAKVAGVPELVMTAPTPEGRRNDLVLAAAHLAGVDVGFCIGGAQAIAALAFGTETVPKVDKIVGPGGVYVACAKRLVFGEVGIDLIAGPSEVLVIADGSSPVDWIALDLFSQAEHDAAAQALLLSPDPAVLDAVTAAMARLIDAQPRRATIRESLRDRGALIRTRDLDEAFVLANRVAPEHLELCLAQPERWLGKVANAGAIFLGAHSPEVMGDYVAGPSHVLPTAGTARFSSPLGVDDFRKRSSIVQLSSAGARALARVSAELARGEGLHAHAAAASAREQDPAHNRAHDPED